MPCASWAVSFRRTSTLLPAEAANMDAYHLSLILFMYCACSWTLIIDSGLHTCCTECQCTLLVASRMMNGISSRS